MQQRAIEYGPIYKEKIGAETFVVISDPKEYMNVIRVDGKYPNRREVGPMVKYLKKRGMTLGLVNRYISYTLTVKYIFKLTVLVIAVISGSFKSRKI